MELKAEIRTRKGKSGAKKVRREGKIPAILYGRGEDPILIQIDKRMSKSINIGEHLTLMLDKPVDTIVKDIQIEPTTSKIIHIDFQHLHRGEKVKVKVPIILEGTEVVAKKGGILEQILTEIEIECLPRDIPSGIKVDVSSLEVGESMHLKDLPPIKGTYITPLEATVATVLVPKAKEEKPPVEEVVPEEEEKVEEEKSKEEK